MSAPKAAYTAPLTQGVTRIPSYVPPPLSGLPVPRAEERQALRSARRVSRAHNPIRAQGVRPHEGGKGRTRGATNCCPREIEVLLDFVEEELPVGAKGWNTVGTRFREWAAISEYPARTDCSLEAKYKQVRSLGPSCAAHP